MRTLILISVAVLFAVVLWTASALAGEHRYHGYYHARPSGDRVPRPYGQNWHQTGLLPGGTVGCADGTTSFSEHPNAGGTCAHHGGR